MNSGTVLPERIHRVNYGTVARAAEQTETTLMYLLRQVVMTLESAVRKDYNLKLNLKIGFLKFKGGSLIFENNATANEIDQLSKSSFNTQFRNNKLTMTQPDNQSVAKSVSIKDAISRFTSTPRSSKRSSFGTLHKGQADPNQIDLKSQERLPRRLNSIVEGKYSKRMSISGKDCYQNAPEHKANQRAILEQAETRKNSIFHKRSESIAQEQDMVSQI